MLLARSHASRLGEHFTLFPDMPHEALSGIRRCESADEMMGYAGRV